MLVSGLIYGLFCLTVKATFWWDSIVYLELSEYMKSLVLWRDYHHSEYRFLFQHIGYGLSALIRLIELIQGNDSLIALIIFQKFIELAQCLLFSIRYPKKIQVSFYKYFRYCALLFL